MAWVKKANLRGPIGPLGPRGPQGLPGAGELPTDEAVAEYVATEGASATKAALEASFLGSRKMFAGMAGFAYENSYGYPNYAAVPYMEQLPERLGLASMSNRAQSAQRAQDIATLAVKAGTPQTWVAPTHGMVTLGGLLNNLIEPDTLANRAAALESIRALAALFSASARVEQGGWANTGVPGGGMNSAQAYASGGSVAIVTANGATIDIPVNAGSPYVLCYGADGTTLLGGQWTFTQGAATIATRDFNELTVKTGQAANNGFSPVVVRLPNVATGTVRATYNNLGRAGAYGVIDALLPQQSQPPLVVLITPLPVLAATHNKPALLTYLRTVPDLVAAEFANVIVIDPIAGWDPAIHLGPDLLHPNPLGQAHIRDAITTQLIAAILRRFSLSLFPGLV
jgi:hypothetical protein